ncbi:MAG: Thiol-disulfide isomerase and thioredoxin [Pseudomonadota bacterium]|jgi:peroxiredoxin
MRSRRAILVLAVMIGALASGVGIGLWRMAPTPVAQVQWLYDLSFPDTEGRPVALSTYRGSYTLVNFWATWCPPCIEEMPELSTFHDKWSSKGINVLGLAVDSPSNVREFLEDKRFSYPLLITGAAGTELARRLGSSIDALPYTALVDPEGRVVQQKMGRIYEEELMKWAETAK